MSPEGNSLDLNNFPEDHSRDGKQTTENNTSSTGHRKKKSRGKDESGKIYECRFCSLKFCKSQALGGHMNRHRQERETETLNRARQLVFNNDNLAAQAVHHHLGGHPIPHGVYHQPTNMNDPNPFRPLYPPPQMQRPFVLPHQQFLYPAHPPPPPPRLYSSSQDPIPPPPSHDYIIGHVVSGNSNCAMSPLPPLAERSHFTCIGDPIRHDSSNASGNSDMATSSGRRSDGFQDRF